MRPPRQPSGLTRASGAEELSEHHQSPWAPFIIPRRPLSSRTPRPQFTALSAVLELTPNFLSLSNIGLLNQQFSPVDLKANTTFFFFFLKQNLLPQSKQLCLARHLPKDSVLRNTPLPADARDKDQKHTLRVRSVTAPISAVHSRSLLRGRWKEILIFILQTGKRRGRLARDDVARNRWRIPALYVLPLPSKLLASKEEGLIISQNTCLNRIKELLIRERPL